MAIKILDQKGRVVFDDPTATVGSGEYVYSGYTGEMFVQYVKGDETSADIQISFYDKELDAYFPLKEVNGTPVTQTESLPLTDTYAKIITTLKTAEKIKIDVSLTGAATAPGSIVVSVKESDKAN